MIFWVMLAILLNGIISFVYSVQTTQETTNLWAMLAVNFIFFAGITQAGIAFSVIMRLARSEWGRHFSRLGEVLTLSSLPVTVIVFIIIYISGTDHLFYWAHPDNVHGHVSPWVGRGLFFWRNSIANVLFYITSYLYFSAGRREEKQACPRMSEAGAHPQEDLKKRLNILAGAVCFFYVIANTMFAWDFGMMIIPHWESSIFPVYFWSANLLAGVAFLYLISLFFIPGKPGEPVDKETLDSMGKTLIGFVLLWVYLFWSQYIVLWYGDLPHLTGPVYRQMEGHYATAFRIMLAAIFIVPFLALILRCIKLSAKRLAVVAVVICIGVWINKYLTILPVFSEGGTPVIATWTGISLMLGWLAATLLSLIIFFRLFPDVKAAPEQE
ncbi:MAG: hypothetical protein HZB21_01305 [Deltaproteobacteria bacterium]|nr:hypothetical protein [Deltaproteobacteria bacterium]